MQQEKNDTSSDRTPTLAAVILNYNYARFVSDAIESALAQDPPFDDIVVVDDGSTDHSLTVINHYQPRVRVLAKENGGPMSACLAGVRAVSTDYVYVMDADDYIVPEFIRSVKPLLATGSVKIQFQLMGVDANKNPLGGIFPTYAEGYGSREMIEDNRVMGFYMCPPTSGNIFRTDALRGMKLESINLLRDNIDGTPALAMPYLGSVISRNQALAYYRAHGGGFGRWNGPDASQLQTEIDDFGRRWAEVCMLLDFKEPPFGRDQPLYVLERLLMQSALLSRADVPNGVRRYMRRLLSAHVPTKQKLILICWALAFLLPVSKWRKNLVLAKRSPLNRPQAFGRLINWLLRYRKVRPSLGASLRQ